jgi:hypothetical protein
MGRNIGRRAAAVLSLGLWLLACSGSSKNQPAESDCQAGARRCDGSTVMVCKADGSAESAEETCAAPQTCADGQCVNTACVPNTKFCKDGSIWKCDSTGGGSALSQLCGANQFCLASDDDAECSDTSCIAGEATCDGDVATKCKPDGSGPAAGGTDCAKAEQVCHLGKCQARTCAASERLCQHDDVYLCDGSGTSMTLLVDCEAAEVCDGNAGACRPRVCEPGKLDCDTSRVVQCNQFGSGWEQSGSDCAAQGQVCVDGACKKQTCTANATFCEEGNVYQCDAQGIGSKLYQTCSPDYYHCEQYPASNYAQCSYNQCTPGALLCDGNYVKTCTANATIPTSGTDCGVDKYCENGACKPAVCKPYEYFCENDDVYYCDDFGRAAYLQQSCLEGSACQLQPNGGALCATLPCQPSSTACVNNQVGTCKADGSGLAQVTQDCAAAGNVCSANAACAESVVDELGIEFELETQSSGFAVGDVIDVTSSRQLTKLEAYLTLVSPRDLRWVVFEQVGSTFVARIDKVVANQKGSDYFSSGPLSFTLKSGKRYLFAVNVTGGSYGTVYDYAPWSPQGLSFGNQLGALVFYYQATIDAYFGNDRIYQMRLTTELP